jgi:protein-L-isoaspartate(D-aspartate) O-methyltransferase
MDVTRARRELVHRLERSGINDFTILRAIGEVPREEFVAPELREFAYQDSALPIAEGQTISQPFIVALMAAAARLRPTDRVLEVGTGSGYAAAVLSHLVAQVYSVERHGSLAEQAAARLERLGCHNVQVRHGDGTLGWAEHAPYDAILVAAGGRDAPPALVAQLAPGGRLVMPVGETPGEQQLVRWVRENGRLHSEDIGAVRFVPLIGEGGWSVEAGAAAGLTPSVPSRAGRAAATIRLLSEAAEPFASIDTSDVGSLVERIGRARVVLLGEATHGTSEFYRMRARITRELIERHGFRVVAIEGDWPDAAYVHRRTRGEDGDPGWVPFQRFPAWMWRNRETQSFFDWLARHNAGSDWSDRAGFYGLDLYSLHRSADAVITYLDKVDGEAASVARARYGCLTPWERDPAAYGRAAARGRFGPCQAEVVAMLQDLLARRLDYIRQDGHRFLDAVQNARLVADAERYYCAMYWGGHESWNLRDRHMFDTLRTLLSWHGPDSRAVVWAHNSHVGDATATEVGTQGQINIGSLCRDHFGSDAFLVGFGTDHGTVAAADDWGGQMEIKTLLPARAGSYEALFHATDVRAFLLHLREPAVEDVRVELAPPRLERAVGVVYRPQTELQSHYFRATLPDQFDAWLWFDETRAVDALSTAGVIAHAR